MLASIIKVIPLVLGTKMADSNNIIISKMMNMKTAIQLIKKN